MSEQVGPNPAEMYQNYFVPGIFARWAPLLLEHAAPQRGERVLDVACGTGAVARRVAPIVGEDGAVVGVDMSPEMLEVARNLPAPEGAAIEWREGDAGALPLPDGAFDLVLCQQGLQFFPDRAAALREMRRVLMPGGRVALSVWQGLERHPLYEALCAAEARYLNTSIEVTAGPPFSMGDAGELCTLLEEAGFREVEITPVSHTVRFHEPERFVALTTMASAAVIPAFSEMDEAERSELVPTVSREIEGTLQQYVEGDMVSFPMHAHIALAYA